MGTICSKASTHSGGDIVLSSTRVKSKGGQQLGESTSQRPDPRTAAAEAAEQRRKAVRSFQKIALRRIRT